MGHAGLRLGVVLAVVSVFPVLAVVVLVQQMLGHESMTTTSGFYAFATIETLANSMAAANKEESLKGRKWNNKEILKKIYSL